MMNEMLNLLLAIAAGIILGVIFFGGLWWTVRKGISSPHPALLFLGSLIVRMSVVVLGVFFVSQGEWKQTVACLLGFLLARVAVMRWTGARLERSEEGNHAS
jgi:F1F0 ATPase subunit 2